jgi:hypothetical protein
MALKSLKITVSVYPLPEWPLPNVSATHVVSMKDRPDEDLAKAVAHEARLAAIKVLRARS